MSAAAALIVGASAAGVAAARALREGGWQGRVVLIDGDAELPYERPPLSKRMLEDAGASSSDFPLLRLQDAGALGIELCLGHRVTGLDAHARTLTLADGSRMDGDHILLATGGLAGRLALPGADLAGVHTIRSYADALALRAGIAQAEHVAVVGGGLIGTEAAVAIARAGRRVTWIDAAARPLAHIFPAAITDFLVAEHLALGVCLRAGVRLRGFTGKGGVLTGIEFDDGEILPADIVVLGVGMVPDDRLARAAGLAVSRGIHVDAGQRTGFAQVLAAGDVAAVERHGVRSRHEHWREAEFQGQAAARSILGEAPLAEPPAWFWSDQGGHHVEMAGERTADCVERQGGRGPVVFMLREGRVAGVASVNEPNAVRIGMRLIQAGRMVDRAALGDAAADLRGLLRG